MALKKPADFFVREPEEDNNIEETENNFSLTVSGGEVLQAELDKVQNLSEQITQLQQELSQKVVQSDLEKIVLSQIKAMQENFNTLQSNLRESNEEYIFNIRTVVSELSELVANLLEHEIPKYKKQVTKNKVRVIEEFNIFKEEVSQNSDKLKEDIETVVQVIDNTLQGFSEHIEGTTEEVKKTSNTYTKLSKILEKKLTEENKKLEGYSQNIKALYEKFVEFQELFEEKNKEHHKTIEETFNSINLQVDNKFEGINETICEFRTEITDIKVDVAINEQHLKNFGSTIENVDKYLQENHQELIELKEEVFGEIQKLSVGNLQENIDRLEKKIDFIKETYSKIEPEVIVREVISTGLLNEPPENKNSDPLTPLDKKFVTLDQLQEHYRLFINRIQQQLSTIGGGGETRLEFLDDVDRNSAKNDGKFLKYDATSKKWVGADGGGGNSDTSNYAAISGFSTTSGYAVISGVSTLSQGLTGIPNINVGVLTATSFYGPGSNITLLNASNLSSGTVPAERINASSGNFTVGQNLFVTGSLSIGGTSIILNAATLQVADKDIVVGYTTDANNNDVSNDNTANHGGISVASTVGSPIINIPFQVGVNSNPATYKQFMWIKQGNYSGMGTDAWVSNYAISIGNTSSVQFGSRLTVGAGFTVYDTYLDAQDIRAKNINSTGIVTALTFVGNLTGTATTANNLSDAANITTGTINSARLSGTYGINVSYATTAGIATVAQGLTGTPNITVGIATASSFVGNLTGTATTSTVAQGLTGTPNITVGIATASSFVGNLTGTATTSTVAQGLTGTPNITVGIATVTTLSSTNSNLTNINSSGITTVGFITATNLYVAGIATVTTLSSTNSNLTNINSSGITTVGFITATNLYVAGVGTFLSSGLKIRNPANTFGYTITGAAIAADRILNLPLTTATDTLATLGLSQTFSAAQTFSSTLTHSATTTNFTASSYTTGTFTIGGASQTGAITIGQATVSQTLNLASGVSAAATTKTINLGTGGAAGSNTLITIGAATAGAASTITIPSPTNLIIGAATSTGTTSQPLQVTGGAYVSGSVGIGTTNPQSTLQVKDALAFETVNTTTTSTTQVAVDTFPIATFRSAKYQAQITCPGQIATLGGITTGGTGYTPGTFNVTFSNSSGTGSAAQGTLVISNGTVAQIGVSSGGTGYLAGDVLTAGGGSGLQVSVGSTAAVTGAILTLGAITSAGIGYTAGVGVGTTTLTFLGGTGSAAVGLATIFDGVITSSTLLQQPTTGTGGTVFYSGSNYTTASVLTINKSDVTNTITDISGSVGVSTFTSLTAHGIGVSDVVRVSSTSNGLTAGTDYYVVTTPSTTTFTLGSSVGIGTTFTTGSSLAISFYRNNANAGGSFAYLNAITGISTNYQVSDLLILQNGTTADYVEYGTIANNDVLGTFATDISSTNARLLLTPTYPNNNVKVVRQAITL
jgi:hypothetical protein